MSNSNRESMNVIVTDDGFRPDDWNRPFEALDALIEAKGGEAVDVASDTSPEALERLLGAKMIRVDFPSSNDGRGFTLARQLRRLGYPGRLRARGHVLADQYAMARRSGFDEVEIAPDLARRQTEDQWLSRADWQARDYQSRLRG